jgi:hypothetical protein
MNSQQEQAVFEQYGWWKDLVGRRWVAPDDAEITFDQVMDETTDFEGDLALMALIVKHGVLDLAKA